jgi:hypothetical protein
MLYYCGEYGEKAMPTGPGLMENIHNIVDALALFAVGLSTIIGYKVHSILFNMKLMERIAMLEGATRDHERDLDKLSKKVFGV